MQSLAGPQRPPISARLTENYQVPLVAVAAGIYHAPRQQTQRDSVKLVKAKIMAKRGWPYENRTVLGLGSSVFETRQEWLTDGSVVLRNTFVLEGRAPPANVLQLSSCNAVLVIVAIAFIGLAKQA